MGRGEQESGQRDQANMWVGGVSPSTGVWGTSRCVVSAECGAGVRGILRRKREGGKGGDGAIGHSRECERGVVVGGEEQCRVSGEDEVGGGQGEEEEEPGEHCARGVRTNFRK